MLRTIFKSDLPKLLNIENAVHVVPWTEETFKTCFQSSCMGWVIEINQAIIGFIIISMATGDCHILNVCVEHAFQNQGYGRKMLEHALEYAREQKVGIAYLEVRRSNTKAISLYRKMKFHLIGERKGYYPTVAGEEDALVFAKNLREEV